MKRSVLVAFFSSAPLRLSLPPHPGASNVTRTLTRSPWRTDGILSLADVRRPRPRRLQQHRSAVSSPTLSFYGRPNHAASWTGSFLPLTLQLLHR
uniref:Uncharacterized protein n=1 Tax=Ixodes scapularis TaxID=6945 RepID=A0A4D5RZN2_IXOSC